MLSDPRHFPRLSTAFGGGVFKAYPEDFKVTERLPFTPRGEGEHLFFKIEKVGLNSADVAAQLAEILSLPRRLVSFAGRKDKQAVATQWFSAHRAGIDRPRIPDQAGWRVREVTRHQKRLQRGSLAGNHFQVLLRTPTLLAEQLPELTRRLATGVPNFFGPQRFGWDNFERAQQGQTDEMAVAAARAGVFNRMLAARIDDRRWAEGELGEPWLRRDSKGWLPGDTGAPGDPSLPLYGPVKCLTPEAEAARWAEFRLFAADVEAVLEAANFTLERRRTRVVPGQVALAMTSEGVSITADLPPGSYMSAVLASHLELRIP